VRLLRARLQLRELLTIRLGDPARRVTRAANHSHWESPTGGKL